MDKFLALKRSEDCPVPPISRVIEGLTGNLNVEFFKAGNILHSRPALDPIYTYVAIRDLVEMFPLGNGMKTAGEDDLKATMSFKWLYLLYGICSRKIGQDEELEKGKNLFLFEKCKTVVTDLDLGVPGAAQFLVGVLCFMARLLDAVPNTDKEFVDEAFFQRLLELLKMTSFPECPVSRAALQSSDLFAFLCPLPMEYLPSTNLFADCAVIVHAAVLRVMFRVLSLKKPVASLDEFKDVVQELSVRGLTMSIARQVLVLLFDGDEAKVSWFSNGRQFSRMAEKLRQFSEQTNGFKAAMGYDGLIPLANVLKEIFAVAEEYPEHWKSFLSTAPNVVNALEMIVASEYDSSFVIGSIKLLRIGETKFESLDHLLSLFISSGSSALRSEISTLLLAQPEAVTPCISRSFAAVCRYGSRSDIFFKFLAELLQKVSDPAPLLSALMKSIKDEFDTVQRHPNSHIYTQLANYIAVSGSYLDQQPCSVCNNPERNPTAMKLEDIREGTKYTHDTILAKLKFPLLISSFGLSLNLKKRSRIPRAVEIYVSSAELRDLNSLKGEEPQWQHIADINFAKDGKASPVKLPVQVFATCLKFRFATFWEDHSSGSVLRCPACDAEIPDRQHGHCPRCRENAYHCRECRHINYNHLDGFICCECGSSNYVNMDWTVTAVQTFSHSRVASPEDMTVALTKSDELLTEAHGILALLGNFRQEITRTLSPSNPLPIGERISKLNTLYNDKCKSCSRDLTAIVQHVSAIRFAIATYLHLLNGKIPAVETNMCYNCRATYIKNGLAFFAQAAENSRIEDVDAPSLLMSFVDTAAFTGAAVGALVQFCRVRPDLTQQVILRFKDSLPNPSDHIVKLLCDIAKLSDEFILQRFKAVVNAITISSEYMHTNASMTSSVLEPLVTSVLSSSLIIKSKDYQLVTIFNAWCRKKQIQKIDPLDVLPKTVIKSLLLDCDSRTVREAVSKLLTDASELSPAHFKKVTDFTLSILDEVKSVTPESEQWIQVLKFLLVSPKQQCHAMVSGIFGRLLDLFAAEAESVLAMEHTLVLDLSIGSSLSVLAELLSVFVNGVNIRYILQRQEKYFTALVHLFMRLRCLIIQRSKHIDLCLTNLRDMLKMTIGNTLVIDPEDKLAVPNSIGESKFLAEAVDCLQYGHVSVARELCDFLFPKRETMNVPIITRKVRSQEDYIPGRVPKDPVNSKNIGCVMRDIKNKICTDLNMTAMLEDDHGMELLVCGNIISLDVFIEDVYKRVWVPAEGETPMVVFFRLQGLDGEATEPVISFQSTHTDDIAPEQKFAYTSVLSKTNGLNRFLDALAKDTSNAFVTDAMRLLSAFAAVKVNRQKLAETGGIDIGFKVLSSVINQNAKADLIESILVFILTLVREVPSAEKQPEEHIDLIFRILGTQIIKDNESLLSPLLALLPPLASGSQSLMRKVLTMFIEGLRPTSEGTESANIFEKYSSLRLLNGFGEFALALPVNESGNAIRDGILKLSFVDDAIRLILENFPLVDGQKDEKKWSESVDIPALPALIKTLTGMVCGHKATQELILQHNMIPLLLDMEQVVSQNRIGELVSTFLSKAVEEPSLCAKPITEQREARVHAAQERARLEKEKILAEAGRSLSPALKAMLDGIEEDEDWECCICKEGYGYLPGELLGFYVMEQSIRDFYFTTTHFICVHNKCHNMTRANDRRGRQPVNEWASAAVRNCERPCNGIFPIPSESISRPDYLAALRQFYSNFDRGCPPWRCIIKDVWHAFEVLSGACAEDASNTGVTKEISILPFLIYAGHLLLGQSSGAEPHRAVLAASFGKNMDTDLPLAYSSTLWICSLEEWNHVKLEILKLHIKSLNLSDELSDADLFGAVKPALLTFVLMDKIQKLLKTPSGQEPEIKDGKLIPSGGSDRPWIGEFLDQMESDSMGVWNSWNDLGEEYKDEIVELPDAKTAFIYTDDLNKVADPLAWIRQK